ncbi:MAG: 4-(cytidine 5'-diphospho)-2-C-methyl-D-erythritol kinase [Ktedonobacterales bacterium]
MSLPPSVPSHPVYIPAYAKVNLTLAVLGRRADGYHRLSSVMQTISLHDTLRLSAAKAREPKRVTCFCDLDGLPMAENLAYRAAILLQRAACVTAGVSIEAQKVIPAQGGLGGGSSDAAAILNALNILWAVGYDAARLEALGAQLGSDVPFFIGGGTALIEGRGEVVTPLPDAESLWYVLVKPPVAVSTAAVFGSLDPAEYDDATASEALVAAIRAGEPLPFERLSNTLERGVMQVYPAIAAARDALLASGAPIVRMSGSGPTLYAPFRTLAEAATVYRCFCEREQTGRAANIAWLCHTVSREQATNRW